MDETAQESAEARAGVAACGPGMAEDMSAGRENGAAFGARVPTAIAKSGRIPDRIELTAAERTGGTRTAEETTHRDRCRSAGCLPTAFDRILDETSLQ